MLIEEEEIYESIKERHIDFALVELFKTSKEFRQWFLRLIEPETQITGFEGVRRSTWIHEGESDVEVGFTTTDTENIIILIENKIEASKQNRQAERYYQRGKFYTTNGPWDRFLVCLVAPEKYVSDEDSEQFGNVVNYEDVLSHLESNSHDGTPYFRYLFEHGIHRQRTTGEFSELTGQIADRTLSKVRENFDIGTHHVTGKQVRLESRESGVPSFVKFNAYIPGGAEGDKAIVRINPEKIEGYGEFLTDLRQVVSEHIDELAGFEERDNDNAMARSTVFRSEFDSQEEYIEEIITKLEGMITHYHPILKKELTTSKLIQDNQQETTEED